MITVFAPDGAGEVVVGTDLADLVLRTVAADPHGPLVDGDVVVVTSKVLSKAAGLARPGADREAAVDEQTVRTVARRGPTRIVRTRHGLTLAAAGVDASNVAAGTVLVLPADPDADAADLLAALAARTGLALAVVVSDTAGRAWREGQTDQAIGAAGLRVLERYAGRQDGYGNDLKVTAMAVADEVAGAADLVKGKLAGRPVAVVRGLGHLVQPVGGPDGTARALVRDPGQDMFSRGAREAVLLAALTATGQPERYEEVVALDEPERTAAVLAGTGPDGEPLGPQAVALVRALLAADLR
ncbi:coenzyme F420-0:L-glutamate ligase [Microlunatus capsulatus]|uniref:Coenzyme F420-0:L-glutamate ligase/coenzyme F420-1:gamma-L-glutamate ligase n=1 Tax=Microlunatus capsulatus TaxID=99117 RepID=A0ABS4Z5L9_9ACTN|nr:coenzyme F420-0:L-glutamate ligase [Microlunatus capsulatus]MBP2416336.1 coenzyme F420-0:L-glutamate ligase/coenzyme F420-1:gamma-L-glutamate ligase [Microlunatus capsulatus]